MRAGSVAVKGWNSMRKFLGFPVGAASKSLPVTFSHGARHLQGTGLSNRSVESVIRTEIQAMGQNVSGNFWGRVQVGSHRIEYCAYTLPDRVNVGAYYIK